MDCVSILLPPNQCLERKKFVGIKYKNTCKLAQSVRQLSARFSEKEKYHISCDSDCIPILSFGKKLNLHCTCGLAQSVGFEKFLLEVCGFCYGSNAYYRFISVCCCFKGTVALISDMNAMLSSCFS